LTPPMGAHTAVPELTAAEEPLGGG
jgi:hypothetical protein